MFSDLLYTCMYRILLIYFFLDFLSKNGCILNNYLKTRLLNLDPCISEAAFVLYPLIVQEFKSNEITFNKMLNKVFGYLFFLILTFWLSIRSKPSEIQPNDRTFPQNICSISPELLSISNRLCCLCSSTRDNTLRKSTFPLMSNHRYGLRWCRGGKYSGPRDHWSQKMF